MIVFLSCPTDWLPIPLAYVIAGFASLGLPGLSGFVAEMTIFVGAFQNDNIFHRVTTIIAISLYENNEAMERATAARTTSLDSNKDNIVSVDMKVGTVELNHSKGK